MAMLGKNHFLFVGFCVFWIVGSSLISNYFSVLLLLADIAELYLLFVDSRFSVQS